MMKSNQGGKAKKSKPRSKANGVRELIFKEAEQEYGQVIRMLGDCRFECYCFDGVRRLAHIRGKLKSKVWINVGDIVLVALREYQDSKCDAFHKYLPDEIAKLRRFGELPDSISTLIKSTNEEDESFVFEYEKEEKGDSTEEESEEYSDDDDDSEDENDETFQKKQDAKSKKEAAKSKKEIESVIMNEMRQITKVGGIQLDELKRRDSLEDI